MPCDLLLKFTWVNLVLASRMDLSNYLIFECQKLFVCSTRLHPKVERAVGVGFQPGLQPAKVVSAFQAGDIQFLDMRNLKEAYLTIDALGITYISSGTSSCTPYSKWFIKETIFKYQRF
ncbi:hypothetical protein HAX54_019479 [Datura stramonium]|uniref:Uncharacterized protein n=1 Tax=Datura stramonium TaxID=4076 RepID=A0ABS8S282_DATST|nr:hypothetical protein [Datura stramonium]